MSLPDFASITSTLHAQRVAKGGVVVVVVIRNHSTLPLNPAQRMTVTETGELAGKFPPSVVDRLRDDAIASLAERRSRLRSYRIFDGQAEPVGPQSGDLDLYFEVLDIPPHLVVVGGGHIAVPLVKIANLLGFKVSVLDDRADFATPARFPEADTVLHGPYTEILAGIPMDANTFVVLVTRGHVHDVACLELVIDSPVPYIGMIGSKKRVRTVFDQVLGSSTPPEIWSKLYAPIGIDIGSTTPEEIAVAIAAELVKVRRDGSAASLRLQERTHV